MNLPGLKIGNKVSKYPLIQGGMGVGVSAHKLAGTVAKEGGIGIISTADIGYKEKDFSTNQLKANLRAINQEIDASREISPDGIIGVNIMVALTDYDEMVKEVVKKGIDLIISGAGLPKNLPALVKGSNTKIAPIISSAKGAKIITKLWMTKYNYLPDLIIVEGPKAGGHLGFKLEELDCAAEPTLENITKEVLEEVKKTKDATGVEIPVVVAGGIYSGEDISKFLKLGANGVQMATRFVATNECDASEEFKNAYINANQDDLQIIKSPVGMPGRAIRNMFTKKMEQGRQKITGCCNCIRSCNPADTPYCITKALINAVKGNLENGLIFCGSTVGKIKEIISVHDLIQELMIETKKCFA
ncbi:MAG: nitronate monooxygenase family protein [Oscillospiraceae bacterium]